MMIDTDTTEEELRATENWPDSPVRVSPISSGVVAPGQCKIMGMGLSWEFAKKTTHGKGNSVNITNDFFILKIKKTCKIPTEIRVLDIPSLSLF